jgi:hypothetical protein
MVKEFKGKIQIFKILYYLFLFPPQFRQLLIKTAYMHDNHESLYCHNQALCFLGSQT